MSLELVPTGHHPDASLWTLAARANEAHEREIEHAQGLIIAAIETGEWLLEAKKQVPDGEWAQWVDQNCIFSASVAVKRMRLAKHRSLILTQGEGLPSISRALAYIRGLPSTDLRDRHARGGSTTPHADGVRAEALRLRETTSLTYMQIGDMLGISKGTVWKWCNPDAQDPRTEGFRRRQRYKEIMAEKRRRELERAARSTGGALSKAYSAARTALQALDQALHETDDPAVRAALRAALTNGYALEDDLGRALRGKAA